MFPTPTEAQRAVFDELMDCFRALEKAELASYTAEIERINAELSSDTAGFELGEEKDFDFDSEYLDQRNFLLNLRNACRLLNSSHKVVILTEIPHGAAFWYKTRQIIPKGYKLFINDNGAQTGIIAPKRATQIPITGSKKFHKWFAPVLLELDEKLYLSVHIKHHVSQHFEMPGPVKIDEAVECDGAITKLKGLLSNEPTVKPKKRTEELEELERKKKKVEATRGKPKGHPEIDNFITLLQDVCRHHRFFIGGDFNGLMHHMLCGDFSDPQELKCYTFKDTVEVGGCAKGGAIGFVSSDEVKTVSTSAGVAPIQTTGSASPIKAVKEGDYDNDFFKQVWERGTDHLQVGVGEVAIYAGLDNVEATLKASGKGTIEGFSKYI